MPIQFHCPHCKRGLSVKDELAGKRARCPGCKGVLTVPAGPAAASDRPAPATSGASPHSPGQIGGGKSPPAGRPKDFEAEAAALLLDDAPAEDAGPAFIDFPCPYCRTYLHLEMELSGRRVSCPNSACRRILHVPRPLNKRRNR
jgi:hypothetical protein